MEFIDRFSVYDILFRCVPVNTSAERAICTAWEKLKNLFTTSVVYRDKVEISVDTALRALEKMYYDDMLNFDSYHKLRDIISSIYKASCN